MINRIRRFYQFSSIVLLLASWEIMGICDAKELTFLHPLVWFGYCIAIYSAIIFITAPELKFANCVTSEVNK